MGKKPGAATKFHCGRCTDVFKSKQALKDHMQNHEDAPAPSHKCPGCVFFFPDSILLEKHQRLNNHWGTAARYDCDRCSLTFNTQQEFNRHRKLGQPCCDAFHSKDWKKASRPGYIDPDKPSPVSKQALELEYGNVSTGTPSDMSDGQEYCHYCKKTFASEFACVRHLLACTAFNTKQWPDSPPATPVQEQEAAPPTSNVQHHTVTVQVPSLQAINATAQAPFSHTLPPQTMTLRTKAPVSHQPRQDPKMAPLPRAPAPSHSQTPSTQPNETGAFVCNIKRCQRNYNSEQGLKMHQTDAHGIGGKGLDLHGKDSWMLGQRERERLKAEGLLQAAPDGPRGGRNNRGGRSRGGRAAPVPAATSAPSFAAPTKRGPAPPDSYHQAAPLTNVKPTAPRLPTGQNIGGALEMEQAKTVCGKTLRLLLQTDIFIHNDGKMSVGGIDWTRIGVERQPDVVELFNRMCHLPRKLQALEYLPAPKTFQSEYNAQYPVTEFESAPARDPAKPGLGIIAMACSKIILTNRCQEVVKIAAIDVLTCRVLMSHLVCTDPNTEVINWQSSATGLTHFKDLENARQAGYKVFKGWTAARSALFKFIDKDTIIVGHNLRSELDALRIVHGRAVDIAKVVEKAAQGPLSKIQVSLDSWCRDIANVARLKTDPLFGRDCVMTAFAAREIGLWSIKNQDEFEKVAKQKTKEYQFVMSG